MSMDHFDNLLTVDPDIKSGYNRRLSLKYLKLKQLYVCVYVYNDIRARYMVHEIQLKRLFGI
jgi:hypothetical protein